MNESTDWRDGEEIITITNGHPNPHAEVQQGAPLTDDQLQSVISFWNAREWAKAASSLEVLDPLAGDLLPAVRLLRGIVANFQGNYAFANLVFQSCLERWSGDVERLGDIERAAAQWLGINNVLLRRWDEAAIALAIASNRVTMKQGSPTDAEEQALLYLSIFHHGGYNRSKNSITNLADALVKNGRKDATFLPQLAAQTKANYLTAATAHCPNEPNKDDLKPPSFPHFSSTLLLTPSTFRSPWTHPLLTHDPTLLLDPRKFLYHAELGNPILATSLTYRFLGKEHFPGINLTALHTTRRPVAFLVDALCTGLAAKGFTTRQYWDRVRAIRVREFGEMDYVASFVVVVHKWYVTSRFGVQIPAALIRDDWRAVRTPGAHLALFPRVCADIKKILVRAEAEAEAAGGPGGKG